MPIQLDLNNPRFQTDFFKLEKHEAYAMMKTFRIFTAIQVRTGKPFNLVQVMMENVFLVSESHRNFGLWCNAIKIQCVSSSYTQITIAPIKPLELAVAQAPLNLGQVQSKLQRRTIHAVN
jgi:hypothetical protein